MGVDEAIWREWRDRKEEDQKQSFKGVYFPEPRIAIETKIQSVRLEEKEREAGTAEERGSGRNLQYTTCCR